MIFGQQSPKIVDSSDNSILLDYSVILVDEPDFRNIIQEGQIIGDKETYHKGYHWFYEIMYHLYKEGNPRSKYETLNALLGETVTLYRHRDKDAFKDSAGTIVPFFFREIIPIFINDTFQYDGLIMKFESTKFVDISQSLDATLITEKSLENITTEDGENLIIG